jgi:UDP-GlcNAc:undecaprenyl-phosphate GlcNAc-1-phosphate transferase
VDAYVGPFLAALVVTFAATPLARRVANATHTIDEPSDRKVHPEPTPTMGGLAMLSGLLVALAVARALPDLDAADVAGTEPLAVVVGGSLIALVGVVDDRWGLAPFTKLVAQIFVAGVVVLLGVQLQYFWFPGQGIVVLSGDLPAVATIAWIVLVANAVNLIDGLDGLAAGIVAIAAAGLMTSLLREPSTAASPTHAALLAAILIGLSLGFLPWNFHRARIFMGDTGSLLLGLVLAVATISAVSRTPVRPSRDTLAAIAGTVALPVLILLVPLIDTAFAVVRRSRRGAAISRADKEHLHHRLMDLGHGHRRAVVLLYLWSGLITVSALAIGPLSVGGALALMLVGASALVVATFWLGRSRARRPEATVP